MRPIWRAVSRIAELVCAAEFADHFVHVAAVGNGRPPSQRKDIRFAGTGEFQRVAKTGLKARDVIARAEGKGTRVQTNISAL
jgi:hypothetical protein